MTEERRRTFPWAIAVALALVTLAVYWPVRGFEYTNYDDQDYVYENSRVTNGLSAESVRWALTTGFAANWHPLTWLSLMLDCELFGVNPGAHHLMNVMYHIAATVTLFAALFAMSGTPGRSGMVAALFALHPLHVESVAWVAERKDVLSGLFWMTTLAAYFWYTRRPGITRYGLVMISFACGLMAKPMLVTLPCVLLLLDFWPLHRLDSFRKRLLEKLPLFALTVASSVITLVVQQKGGAVGSLEKFPLLVRVSNAFVAYASYVGKTLIPENLAVLYPHPGKWPLTTVLGAIAAVLLVTVGVLRLLRSRRYPFVGWFWFLGTLVPVIGLVQVGEQFMADRYTYVPLVGLFIVLVWGACDLAERVHHSKLVLGVASVVVLMVCVLETSRQIQHWRSSVTLFSHAANVTRSNATALYNLGQALSVSGHVREALPHYEEAVRIRTNYADAHNNLGFTLALLGKAREATNHYAAAVQAAPSNFSSYVNYGFALVQLGEPEAALIRFQQALDLGSKSPLIHYGMGQAYLNLGRINDSIAAFRKAIESDPNYSEAHFQLSLALARAGRLAEAEAELRQALRLTPQIAQIHSQLGVVLNEQGKTKEAIGAYRKALQLDPKHLEALNNLAWLLATHPSAEFRNGLHAIEYAERACELTSYKAAGFIGTLAAALAEAGQFDEAQKRAKQAEELARSEGQAELAERNRKLHGLYLARKAYREP